MSQIHGLSMLGNIGNISLGLRSSFTTRNQGSGGWDLETETRGSFTESLKAWMWGILLGELLCQMAGSSPLSLTSSERQLLILRLSWMDLNIVSHIFLRRCFLSLLTTNAPVKMQFMRPVQAAEIKEVIFSLPCNKAPGPYGFPMDFTRMLGRWLRSTLLRMYSPYLYMDLCL